MRRNRILCAFPCACVCGWMSDTYGKRKGKGTNTITTISLKHEIVQKFRGIGENMDIERL